MVNIDASRRDLERIEVGRLSLCELLPTRPARFKITDTEIIAFDGDGRRLGKVVWAAGGRESVGHAEIWDAKMRCDRTARIPEVTSI
jgi:hypothetical protein